MEKETRDEFEAKLLREVYHSIRFGETDLRVHLSLLKNERRSGQRDDEWIVSYVSDILRNFLG